tara:strand:+ start:1402 stop:2910 length:1509 start_codon:yes stop_codon:yes gene_type:complete
LPNKIEIQEDPEIIKKISRAISDNETVLEIDIENRGRLVSSIDKAVDRKVSFAVKPKPLMFVLDFDEEEKLDIFNSYVEKIIKLGYDPIVSESGTPGHRHLICRADNKDEYETLCSISLSCGIGDSIRKNFIRPPGSPHRKGLPVRIVSHERAIDVLSALGSVSSGLNLPESLHLKISEARGLGSVYKSGSELTQSIVNQCYMNGIGVGEIYELLRDNSNKGGDALRSRIKSKGSASAMRWLNLSYEKARNYKASSDRALGDIIEIENYISRLAFKGKAGLTDRDVMIAHLSVARKAVSLRYKTSIRVIANIANIGSLMTVRKSQSRLEERGYLKKTSKSKRGTPSSWEITCNASDTINTMGGCETNVSFARHRRSEAFAWSLRGVKGLGKAGVPVLDVLALEGNLGASAVANKTGLSRQTVYRVLRRLEAAGVVMKRGGLWCIDRVDADNKLVEYCEITGITRAKEDLIKERAQDTIRNRNRILEGCKSGRTKRLRYKVVA